MSKASFEMPAARDFGWRLKSAESALFDIHTRPNGQFCVVLHHALLRGLTSEMIRWWFERFPALTVRLTDTPGYEGRSVPAYYLWHPSDHHSATIQGGKYPDGRSHAGASIRIREAFQYEKYGMTYAVDAALKILEFEKGVWMMGRALPLLGKVMMLRIRYQDVVEKDQVIGVQYHYENVIGVNGDGPLARFVNARVTKSFGQEMFAAWRLHNTIEVGVFENFLPALYAQREDLSAVAYARAMAPSLPDGQEPYDPKLFARRVAGYKAAGDPFAYQLTDCFAA